MKGSLFALFTLIGIILISAYEISAVPGVSDSELMQQVFGRPGKNETFGNELSVVWGERITTESPKTIKITSASKEMMVFLVN